MGINPTDPVKVLLREEGKTARGLKMPAVEGKWTCVVVRQYTR